MLNGITTRTSTPQEDAELWPGGSARPVLNYLTGTLGMTGAGARELLKAARTAQAGAGPGSLADCPVPGGSAHLLIHYAPGTGPPGSSSPPRRTRFRQALTPPRTPRPGTWPARTGRRAAGKRRTAARPVTPAARLPRAARPAGRGGKAGAGEDHAHYLAQRRPR